jgi:hypothetical protein
LGEYLEMDYEYKEDESERRRQTSEYLPSNLNSSG